MKAKPAYLLLALSTLCTLYPHARTRAAAPTDQPDVKGKIEFESPVQLKSKDGPIKAEAPGYAAPCMADMDGDGKKDLLVGQFAGGKINVYRNLGDGKFANGEWLKTNGEVAEIPGVW